jgi:DNA-binding transcriptional ArsR family regulator
MVNNQSLSLDRVFYSLSDPTRREILKMLTRKQYTVGELADPFRMSLAAVSKHIKVLEKAGLLTRARDGRIHRCTMNAAPLEQAKNVIDYYQQFWAQQLKSLDRYLQQSVDPIQSENKKGEKNGRRKR